MNKTIVLLLFMGIFTQISCKQNKKTEAKDTIETTTLSTTTNAEFEDKESQKKCDDFITDYEKWMVEYVDLIAKYKDNPAGLIGDPKYTKIGLKGVEWTTNWANDLSCAMNPKYQKRFNEIQDKIEKKMKEVGLK